MIERDKKHKEKSKQVGKIKQTSVYTANNFTTREMLSILNNPQKIKHKGGKR